MSSIQFQDSPTTGPSVPAVVVSMVPAIKLRLHCERITCSHQLHYFFPIALHGILEEEPHIPRGNFHIVARRPDVELPGDLGITAFVLEPDVQLTAVTLLNGEYVWRGLYWRGWWLSLTSGHVRQHLPLKVTPRE